MKTAYFDTRRLRWLRVLNKCVPLNHKYYAIIEPIIKEGEFALIPSMGFNLVMPTAWVGPWSHIFLGGIDAAIPDFLLVRDVLAGLTAGCILDVGANIGCWSMWCSKVSARPIMAFEPEPATFDVLRRNIELNGLQNATVSNLACGDSDGIIYFHAGPNGYTLLPDHHHFSEEDEGVIQVRCQKLDSIVQDRRVAFIKMDVEGHEWHALRGAAEIIKRDRPALLIEIHPVYLRDRGKSAEEVLSLLKNSYERIELYAPRDRPKSALANFMSRYRTKRIPLRIEEPDFLEQVGRKSPPLQLYAVCKA